MAREAVSDRALRAMSGESLHPPPPNPPPLRGRAYGAGVGAWPRTPRSLRPRRSRPLLIAAGAPICPLHSLEEANGEVNADTHTLLKTEHVERGPLGPHARLEPRSSLDC